MTILVVLVRVRWIYREKEVFPSDIHCISLGPTLTVCPAITLQSPRASASPCYHLLFLPSPTLWSFECPHGVISTFRHIILITIPIRCNMKATQVHTHLLPPTRRPSLPTRPSPPFLPRKPLLTKQPCGSPHPNATKPTSIRLPPIVSKGLPPTHTHRSYPSIPTFTRRFTHCEELLKRIPCIDFVEAVLDREPLADTVLVENIVRLRDRTLSEAVLQEVEDDCSPWHR